MEKFTKLTLTVANYPLSGSAISGFVCVIGGAGMDRCTVVALFSIHILLKGYYSGGSTTAKQ